LHAAETSARMLLQVHDELVFEVKKTESVKFQARVKDLMENAVKLNVPLQVSVGAGPTWGAAH
jgi:DNA polymerase I